MTHNSVDPLPGRRRRTAVVGGVVVAALVVTAFLVSKVPSRNTADRLYWLTSTLTVAAVVTFLVTAISILFRRRSLRFHLALAALAASVALAALPTSNRDQDLPVVFSWGILTPMGAGVCVATVVAIVSRMLFANRSSGRR